PNVVGLPWNEGKKVLTDLGFKLQYVSIWDGPFPIVIEATDPVAGKLAPKGSTISLAGKLG
ncbi:MAG: PASTA domain-containing protein, partial [Cryobacterium sp.]|nr:PASTA domain-containing protein [Cryobacterium sp.]